MDRKIDGVAETLKAMREWGGKCTLLIGSGCSASAGIPTALGLLEKMEERFFPSYTSRENMSYAECMATFAKGLRFMLIDEVVGRARINWAHLALAQLMKEGFINLVLTTNFDQLLLRAARLVDLPLATYDVANSIVFPPKLVRKPAILHLHGLHTGLVLLNTPSEFRNNYIRLEPVFRDAGSEGVWIVAGYSGENDPAFDLLANISSFDEGLYWICYGENNPAPHVQEQLLVKEDTYCVKGYDADNFFVTLAQRLNCFPPDFVRRPHRYPSQIQDMIETYSTPKFYEAADLANSVERFIPDAIKRYENMPEQDSTTWATVAWAYLMDGDTTKVKTILCSQKNPSIQMKWALYWSFYLEGWVLLHRSELATGDEAKNLKEEARQKFQEAENIFPQNVANDILVSRFEGRGE